MSPNDTHQGGDLSDMATTGTKVPGDAGVQNIIKSVPRPDQATSDDAGAADLVTAADNQTDMPRRNQDIGATGEVTTGTGDQLPAQVESKRLHFGANDPQAKVSNLEMWKGDEDVMLTFM